MVGGSLVGSARGEARRDERGNCRHCFLVFCNSQGITVGVRCTRSQEVRYRTNMAQESARQSRCGYDAAQYDHEKRGMFAIG